MNLVTTNSQTREHLEAIPYQKAYAPDLNLLQNGLHFAMLRSESLSRAALI
jgi:hypothetical protein